eukprot:s2528_g22.t1
MAQKGKPFMTSRFRRFGTSRSRTYGIFALLTQGYGPEGKALHDKQIQKIWDLVERCQRRQPQMLQSLLQQAGFVADASKKKPKSQLAMKRPASKKNDPKWIKQHAAFKKKFKITDAELGHEAIKQLKKHPASLDVTEREIDACRLKLAVQLRKGKLDPSNMVCNVGDSVGYLRWSSSLHPCVLPTKKYLYLVNGEMFTNVNCSGGQLYPLLQGLGPREMEMCGLHQKLSASQIQELSGNAFTSNIIAAIMLDGDVWAASEAFSLSDPRTQRQCIHQQHHRRHHAGHLLQLEYQLIIMLATCLEKRDPSC